MCSHVYHTVVLSDCTQCMYEHYIEKMATISLLHDGDDATVSYSIQWF